MAGEIIIINTKRRFGTGLAKGSPSVHALNPNRKKAWTSLCGQSLKSVATNGDVTCSQCLEKL